MPDLLVEKAVWTQLAESVATPGESLFEAATKMGLNGVGCKYIGGNEYRCVLGGFGGPGGIPGEPATLGSGVAVVSNGQVAFQEGGS